MKYSAMADKISIILLSLLILAYSSVLQFSFPSIVLCVGSDGHFAFEPSEVNHQCLDSEEYSDHVADKHKSLSHQDMGCEDIPLMNLFVLPFLEKESKSQQVKMLVVNDSVNKSDSPSTSYSELKNNDRIHHPTIQCLQTTILLM
jgi:hypothetical protein